MVNLSTPPDVMVREIMVDRAKSQYWLKKHFRGDKGYESMRDELMRKCRRDKRNQVSGTVEFRSSNGNRWLTYECARYYKEADRVFTEPYEFCFYETLGSVGAFVPVRLDSDGKSGHEAVLVFTSHFFMQMCERLHITFRTPEMVRAFHEFTPSLVCSLYEEEGRTHLLVRLPGSIGFGIKTGGDAEVFEVRTFLMDSQLNGKQQRLTGHIRLHADKFAYEPKAVRRERMQDRLGTDEGFVAEFEKSKARLMAMGMSEEEFNRTMSINIYIVRVFLEMDLVKEDINGFLERHNANNLRAINQFVKDGKFDNEGLYSLMDQCADNDGFKGFDAGRARQIFRDIYYKRK